MLRISILLFWLSGRIAVTDAAQSPTPLTFERDIRPILKANCFQCHGEGEKLSGGLDVRLQRLLVRGGENGAAIAPGHAQHSLLYQRIDSGEMPPGHKKLTREEIDRIGRWIDSGAPTLRPEPLDITPTHQFTQDEREFWAFQPIARPHLPAVRQQHLVRTAIDAFVLEKLEERELSFAPEADKRTLIRRATLDLIGLPPTPDEVARFLADESPDAFDRVIDRLLASPHYGERWARHWLDVAGYADSEGYTNDDTVRKESYKYRDYVIRSFNADKPFDQFIQEQLAGDEMVAAEIIAGGYKNLPAEAIEKLTATGFLRMAPDGTGSGAVDQKLARNQVISDTIQIVSTSLFGLTVACAECHNHRYDPILQEDYFRLRAVFEPALDSKNWRAPPARLVSLYTDADRAKAAEIEAEAAQIDNQRKEKQEEYIQQTFEKELAKLPEELRDLVRVARSTPAKERTPEQNQLLKEHPSVNVSAGSLYLYDQKAADDLKKYADRAAEIRARKPVEEFLRSLTEVPGRVPQTFLFHRGDPDQPKQAVPPGDLSILTAALGSIPDDDPALPTTGRRLAFAQRLTNGTHPLVARVLVNRIWLHHFGRGLVGTPADFGLLGERPSHPELLDWLASDFMNPSQTPPYEGGRDAWRVKRLHKLIMTSTAYRQSSQRSAAAEAIDPDNRLIARMPVRRIDAEVLRDSILAISGVLNTNMFGSPVPVKEDEVGQVVVGIDTNDSAGRPTGKVIPLGGNESRRSVYIQVRRTKPLAVLETFDAPAMDPNCDSRASSTVAPQSLLLMNNEFVVEHAGRFAERVMRESGDVQRQIVLAWELAWGREPTEMELDAARSLIAEAAEQWRLNPPAPESKKKDAQAKVPDPQIQALAVLCQALLSANEFLYVD